MSIVQLKNITKHFKDREVLKDINFEINEGEILGFVGPNGAGKTTTIKIIVGILSADKGEVLINNKNIKDKKELLNSLNSISCMIENPAVYPYLTGFENLQQIVRSDNRINENDIERVVELVDLKGSINNKVSTYSLGMKQRLGIAQALITKPKLLILDEPTNGLDPVGIVEIRNLLKSFSKKENASVLISSHILGELEQLCDRIIFINDGRILKEEKAHMQQQNKLVIMARDKDKCRSVLNTSKNILNISDYKNGLLVDIKPNSTPELIYMLADNKIDIEEVYKYNETLEDRYMEVYSK